MRAILPCAISLAVTSILVLNGCQSLEQQTPSKPATEVVSQKNTNKNTPPKTTPQKKQPKYEKAPDLSNAEILTAPPKSNIQSSSQTQSQSQNQGQSTPTQAPEQTSAQGGQLISDAQSAGTSNSANSTSTGTSNTHAPSNQEISNNAALADNLESAPTTRNSVLGSTPAEGSVQEKSLGSNEQKAPVLSVPVNNAGVALGTSVGATQSQSSSTSTDSNTSQATLGKFFPKHSSSGCSTELNSEATGIARTLVRELATRLHKEGGNIYVAPTIIDREYKGCVGNLSTAIQDGLSSSDNFQVTQGNVNLSNIAAQNAGSATVLPSIIHQCRAANIPYLVVSQIKKSGDKAALSLRIIKTDDGITLGQTYRRLSQ